MQNSFKVLIFDLDGTAVVLKEDALPSPRVVKAVEAAKKIMQVCVATGRPITNCREILRELDVIAPCVISGGSQIIDPKTEKILWEKKLSQDQVGAIVNASKGIACKLLFGDELLGDDVPMDPNEKQASKAESVVYIMELDEKDVSNLVAKLNTVQDIAAHPMPSWKEGKKDIHVTHELATKQHALEVLLDILKVEKKDVVSVGDSGNDIPLFRVSGYKVAMGNATEELKKAADLIVATIDEDGLAQFIETSLL